MSTTEVLLDLTVMDSVMDEVAERGPTGTSLRRMDLEDTDDRELIQLIRDLGVEAPSDARRILTERYQPLVVGQAAKLHRGRGPDHDDVLSVAQHGLQKAIADYDLDHGAHFAAYARAKVRGEMMRWFRDDRYSVHVPRPLHERFMQVRRAAAELEPVLHRQPDVEEIAEHLDCSVAEVIEAWAVDSAERVCIGQLDERVDGAASLHTPDLDLAVALEELGDRDRLLLYRRFWEGRSQREVGEELGVSQAHVSRLEQHALDQLRDTAGLQLQVV